MKNNNNKKSDRHFALGDRFVIQIFIPKPMMTRTLPFQPTQPSETQSTCASCQYFEDFGETNGRGWYKVLDRCARKHHPKTQDCHWAIASHKKSIAVSELLPCPYEAGQLVNVSSTRI